MVIGANTIIPNTIIRKQPIIALYFEFENKLKFYNLEARSHWQYRLPKCIADERAGNNGGEKYVCIFVLVSLCLILRCAVNQLCSQHRLSGIILDKRAFYDPGYEITEGHILFTMMLVCPISMSVNILYSFKIMS